MAGKARAFVKMIGFRKELKQARNAVNYICFKSQDMRGNTGHNIFDARSDHADAAAFNCSLDDPVSKHSSAAKAYHLLFSLSRAQSDDAGLDGWKDSVRSIIRSYELEYKVKLDWIAAQHDNARHPHCHIVIKGVYADENGKGRRLFLGRDKLDRLKELTARELSARGVNLNLDRELAQQRQRARSRARGVGVAFAWLESRIQAHKRQQQREREEDLQRLDRSSGRSGR